MSNVPVATQTYDPRDWGVTFDGVTDDTAAWQFFVAFLNTVAPAANLETSGGVAFECPPGKTLNGIAHNLPQRVIGFGAGHGTQMIATSDGAGFFNMTGRYQHLRDLHFVAAQGSGAHCLDLFRQARGSWRDLVFTQPQGDRPAIWHDPAGNGSFSHRYDNLVFHHNDDLAPAHEAVAAGGPITRPTFEFIDSNAAFNANHLSFFNFFGGRPGSTAPAMRIVSDSARTHNNQLDSIIGEFCTAGLLHLEAGSGWQINSPSLHDTAGDAITDHVIKLGANTAGSWGSRQNVVIAYDRRDGDLNPGIADIWVDPASVETHIMGLPERPNQNYVFDFNGTTGIVDGFNPQDVNNPDHILINAENVIARGNGSIHRLDTGSAWRTLDRPAGAGPAVWI